MHALRQGNVYVLDFRYDMKTKEAVKKIPGARWNGKNWTVPLNQQMEVERLVTKYSKVNQAVNKPEEYGEIAPLPELEPEVKALLQKELLRMPYHYQEQGIAYILKHKRVMNADDMGGGKTTTSICSIVAAGMKDKCGLIVCKGSGKFMWEREFKVVAGMKSIILNDSVKNTWYQFHQLMGVSVFITNYESLEKFFIDQIIDPGKHKQFHADEHIIWKRHPTLGTYMKDLFKWIVLDESHEIRNESTTKSRLCVELGVGKELRMALSGTPVVNKAQDLYAQLNFLGRTSNTKESKKFFMERYCGGNGSDSTNMKELHYKLRKNSYFRRNTSEFGIDLPELTLQMVYSDITNRKEYDHAQKNLADYLVKMKGKTDAQVEKSMNAEAMVLIGVLQDISARGKMREAIEEVDNALNSGNKIVVFLNQKTIKEALMKHYPQGLVISGSENAEEKNKAEQAFNTTEKAVPIFVSIKAGGVGINLQTSCAHVLFIELPWHPAFYYQCVKRVHRNGQKNAVMSKNLIGKGTIDEKIWEIIEAKKDIADTITGSNSDDVQREVIDKIKDSLFKKN